MDAGKQKRCSFPQRVTLELTNHCNLNCTFCPRCYMEKERGYMDVSLAMDLIDQMAPHAPVTLVPFFRGESTLHPQWYSILKHYQERNIGEIQFTTNASLLTPENSEKLLDLDLSFVSFSLDTVDPDLYNKNRRGADFEKTLENVLYFLKLKESQKSKTQVQVSSVETEEHKRGMDRFVRFWLPKVDRVRVYTEHSSNGNLGSIEEPLPEQEKRLACKKPFTDMVVYWNGEVALCNHDWTRMVSEQPLGNLFVDSIQKVWDGVRYSDIRDAHISGDLNGVVPCESCDHWKMYYLPCGYLGKTYSNNERE